MLLFTAMSPLYLFHYSLSLCDDALIELGSHYANRTSFVSCIHDGITSKSMVKFVDNNDVS